MAAAASVRTGGTATPAWEGGVGEAGAGGGTGGGYMMGMEEGPPRMVRWVSNAQGTRLYVPQSWVGTPAGAVFEKGMGGRMKVGGGPGVGRRKMVEVIDEGGDVVMAGA